MEFTLIQEAVRYFLTTRRGLLLLSGVSLSFLGTIFLSEYIIGVSAVEAAAKRLQLDLTVFKVVLLGIAFSTFALRYLQSGELVELKAGAASQHPIEERLNDLEQLASIQNENMKRVVSDLALTATERELILRRLTARLSSEAVSELFSQQAIKMKEDLVRATSVDRLQGTTLRTINRLSREIVDLRLRANVNMIIGMLITVGGLILLWDTVQIVNTSEQLKKLAAADAATNWQFLKNMSLSFVPRILLVIFIEVFAYFFLKLYANGLLEIKYFQNEMTNVESKVLAVEAAMISNSANAIENSLKELLRTERNFILEKGQTTVELERARSESDVKSAILKVLPELFKRQDK